MRGRGIDDGARRVAMLEQQRIIIGTEGGSAVDGRVPVFAVARLLHVDGSPIVGLDRLLACARSKLAWGGGRKAEPLTITG